MAGALFFVLRCYYWTITKEEPFSDSADYVRIAKGILEWCNFSHGGDFWYSYKPPTMPLILAFYFKLRGTYALDFWPIFQTSLNFFAVIYLIKQVANAIPGFKLDFPFMAVFALSSSSIFWSLKASTEYCSESFLIFLCAMTIDVFKNRSPWFFLGLGFFAMGAILLKPQFILLILIIPTAIFFYGWTWKNKLIGLFFFGTGLFAAWVPWGIRTYRIYGTPILTSTQGPYSFMWELGRIRSKDKNGNEAETDVYDFQSKAPLRYKNDLEAMLDANIIVKQWIKENALVYIKLIPARLTNTIFDESEALTRVPRKELLPSWINWILLDKVPILVVSGIIGLIAIIFVRPSLWPLAAIPIGFWIMGIAFLSYPRVLDPALPIFYLGNYFFVIFWRSILRRKT